MDSNSIFDGFRKVVVMDEIFDVIKSVHENSAAHSGVQKTYEIVSDAHAYLAIYLHTRVTENYDYGYYSEVVGVQLRYMHTWLLQISSNYEGISR